MLDQIDILEILEVIQDFQKYIAPQQLMIDKLLNTQMKAIYI